MGVVVVADVTDEMKVAACDFAIAASKAGMDFAKCSFESKMWRGRLCVCVTCVDELNVKHEWSDAYEDV